MEDHEALQLLQLLRRYVHEYTPDIPQTISALAEDLAQSMDAHYVNRAQAEGWAVEIAKACQ
jgi:hypothetical protein